MTTIRITRKVNQDPHHQRCLGRNDLYLKNTGVSGIHGQDQLRVKQFL